VRATLVRGLAALLVVGLAGCAAPEAGPVTLRYVALGDSYTIGTSVSAEERFPDQLVAALPGDPPPLELVANLGVNGWTSADLIRDELPEFERLDAGFATLLIGVNDVVQGVPPPEYERNVVTILDALLARLPPDRVVVVTIPDYTVTPAGADYGDPAERSAAIEAANAAMTRLAGDRGIAVVDIWDISREADRDRSLVADDGLHPSGAQYARWVERLVPVVQDLLGDG
jgi:acyl-CoA thioesterase I